MCASCSWVLGLFGWPDAQPFTRLPSCLSRHWHFHTGPLAPVRSPVGMPRRLVSGMRFAWQECLHNRYDRCTCRRARLGPECVLTEAFMAGTSITSHTAEYDMTRPILRYSTEKHLTRLRACWPACIGAGICQSTHFPAAHSITRSTHAPFDSVSCFI